MGLVEAVVLGIVQGFTEFLPVSSSGHLVIFPKLLGWASQPLVFDTTLHLATALALIIYFRKDLLDILMALILDFRVLRTEIKEYSGTSRLGLAIIVGSVPAGILGLLFEDAFENYFREIWTVAVFLILGSILMFTAERKLKQEGSEVDYKKGFIIGLFQSLALFPGISRSGSTISGGMLLGLNREQAARFSFLLLVPITVAAGVYKLSGAFSTVPQEMWAPVLAGFFASLLSGLLAISLLLKLLRKYSLHIFIYYRLLLAVFLLVIAFL